MPSPFPGTDSYLEEPALWSGVHQWLIIEIARTLGPLLRPKYIVAVEERVYETHGEDAMLVGIPDDVVVHASPVGSVTELAVATSPSQPITVTLPMPETVREGYLEIRRPGAAEVISVLEVLSPKNKRPGVGRDQYEAKRRKVLGTSTNLVEIDLLRQWEPMPMLDYRVRKHYRILVGRGAMRPRADLYAFNLQDPLPVVSLPLRAEDTEPLIDFPQLFHNIYDLGGYDLRLNYSRNPLPALSKADATWVDARLREQGWR